MKSKPKFYSLSNIMKYDSTYYMIFGERSNGKTYSVLKYHLEQWSKDHSQLAIVRRWQEDIRGKRGASLYSALVQNGEIEKATDGEWNNVYYYSNRWYFCKTDKDGKRIVADEPFAYGFALTNVEHDKGNSYPNIKTILFDEFMSREGYLPDEFVSFMNTISTIVRYRDNVKIFMLGNTVNKYCPYFDEMGINVLNMEKGEIRPYAYGDSDKIKIVVEYADNLNKSKDSDAYFAFDNPKLKMIMGGDWELAQYPHFPYQYKDGNKIKLRPADIIFTYFIKFGEELLQCEIVQYCGDIFTWIHRKTTDIKNPDTDLIYDIDFNPKANYRRRITRPQTDIERKILDFYTTEKVFYQDNDVGEVIRNYLDWCRTAKIK